MNIKQMINNFKRTKFMSIDEARDYLGLGLDTRFHRRVDLKRYE